MKYSNDTLDAKAGVSRFDEYFDSLAYETGYRKDINYWNQVSINEIEDMNIEVEYLGGADIGIDYIRLETPHTRNLLFGQYDNKIHDFIQNNLDKANDSMFTDTTKPFIFRLTSTVEGGPHNWDGHKYMRKLVGDIFSGE